ncbi:hypothetical protein ACIHFE_14080 [Streptomyces sp. NPDC052396]|uniref:hypothetical protein n=1 Tax=Streptomyces sp. NPDC052396 TaxID=3365689 RepID=UPI0037D1D62C
MASALLLSLTPAHAETPTPSAPASPTAPSRPRLEVFGLGPHGHTPVQAGGIAAVHLSGMPPGWDKATIEARPADPNDHLSYFFPNYEVVPRDSQTTESANDYGHYTTDYPGRYVVVAIYHGRDIASTEVTVKGRPYSSYVRRFDIYPRYTRDPVDSVEKAHWVRPGAQAAVSLAVRNDEAGTLQARSPAFEHPLALRMHTSDDPDLREDAENGPHVYAGHIQLRQNLPEGVYPVTVSSHGGRQSVTQNLIVSAKAEDPPPSSSGSSEPSASSWYVPWLWTGLAVVSAGLVAAAIRAARARRRRGPAA